MVSNRGIEFNPDKIKAIEDITVVESIKAIQRLTERMAALGRLISRSSDQSHRFFSLLKKKNNFTWTPECQQLEELKRYLSSSPLLHTPKVDESLYLYLVVSKVTVSSWVKVWELRSSRTSVIPRPQLMFNQNGEADALANVGSSVEDGEISLGTVVKLSKLVVEGHAEINSTSLTWDWRNKCINYLKSGKLPSNSKESRTLQMKATQFTLAKDGTLYRIMFNGPLAICLGPGDTDYVLREIHEGTCRNHSGDESLVHKVIRAGYYWDSMKKDTKEFVRKCDKC
uniref:Uncharacterized protein LOC104228774 n=1 Tax=Nicotiana sylvestris TaxID=4096 RepID=A0A1U7WI44_NICSY|nr:PREDICTED: uncharacterized protein LOC104228774 [Nicotiana sylvestris]